MSAETEERDRDEGERCVKWENEAMNDEEISDCQTVSKFHQH